MDSLDDSASTLLDKLPPSAWLRDARREDIRNVVALVIRKGGAGKTTLLLLIADALSRLGLNVLIVDTDPQGNVSSAAGCKVQMRQVGMDKFGRKAIVEPDRLTLIEVIENGEAGVAAEAVQVVPWEQFQDVAAPWTRGGPLAGKFGTVGIIPCYKAIEGAAIKWSLKDLQRLATTLRQPAEPGGPAPHAMWDVVLIDTPPGGTNIGRLGTLAADGALMVTNAEKFGIEAIPETLEFLTDIRDNYNHPDLQILGLVLNEYSPSRVDQEEELIGLKAAQESGNAAVDVALWPERLPLRAVISRSQRVEAPVSAMLGSGRDREAATAVCPVAEAVALRLLAEIGHPLATKLRKQWAAAWPHLQPKNGG